MRTLGVVLAGGQSRRFGSDKAEALLGGRRLIDHAIAAIAPYCDAIAVVGRSEPGVLSLTDRPRPGLGPLAGIAAALAHADAHAYARVLSVPVDCVALPPNVLALLAPAPAILASQPVIGLWPVRALAAIDDMLAHDDRRSVRAFGERIGARTVEADFAPPNVNTPGDLAALG